MKFEVNFGNNAIAIPSSAVELENPNSFRLLMLLCSQLNNNSTDLNEISQKLGITFNEVLEASDELTSKKIIRQEYEARILSGSQIEQIIQNNSSVKGLFDELCNICGVINFSQSDRSKIISLINDLNMEPEAIALLFSYYADILSAEGKRVSPTYIFNVAFKIRISSYAEIQKYIEKDKQQNGLISKFRSLFGIGSRALSKNEKEAFTLWTETLGYGFDIIKEAYDITVNSISIGNQNQKSMMAYMTSILSDWNKNNVKTLSDIEELRKKHNEKKRVDGVSKKNDNGLMHSFDADEYFNEALKRSYKEVESLTSESKDK